MQTTNFQKNIIQNIRGFYLTQIISVLGKSEYIDSILKLKKIDVKNNKHNFSPKILKIILN